jgi:AraC family transcriptional regulator, regulatory protein of adaptative response / methylated-DNA-[protein]-cysteine methyltransferase
MTNRETKVMDTKVTKMTGIPAMNDDRRWDAVQRRDKAADGRFVLAVKTTRIYCRPSCPARQAKRANVLFFPDPATAEQAGFRACKRCRPNEASLAERQSKVIAEACRTIERAVGDGESEPQFTALAEAAGLSPFHFHRLFKETTGVTPKAFAAAHRAGLARDGLESGDSITAAIYGAGYSSSSRFYEGSTARLGMRPSDYRAGGRGAEIRFAVGSCSLGAFLVAATDKGVCAIMLGDAPEPLVAALEDRFPRARLVGGDADFEALVARVVGLIEAPGQGSDLPLDLKGTAFQQRVWQALTAIPPGTTVSYAEIARRIGAPKAVRAVAQACATNPAAIAVPCHRVVRSDGTIGQYAGGPDLKVRLLELEGAA